MDGAATTTNILSALMSPGLSGKKKKPDADGDYDTAPDGDADDRKKGRKGSALMSAVKKAQAGGGY